MLESETIFAAVAAQLRDVPGVEAGTGFGTNPGLRVGGRIFAMLVHDALVVKLPAERVTTLVADGTASRFSIGERETREWAAIADGTPEEWIELAREAFAFVGG